MKIDPEIAKNMANPETQIKVIKRLPRPVNAPYWVMKIGDAHNDLTALRPSENSRLKWWFQCACGRETEAKTYHVRTGHTKSCGCALRRASSARAKIRNTTHGLKYTPEYRSWAAAKNRCTNRNSRTWERYGGRGITMCDRWFTSPEAFVKDMGKRPSRLHTLERKDNNGPYSPENCIWATSITQGNNRGNNVNLQHNGQTLSISQWARELGVKPVTIYQRVSRGMPVHLALSKERINPWIKRRAS